MLRTITIPKTHKASGILLTAFGHVWEPVPVLKPEYVKNSLPPPFEAYGNSLWKLEKCEITHDGECEDFCIKEAKKEMEKEQKFLKNFNSIFGVTRNKKYASELRVLKKQEKESESESESESETESETETESESEEEEEEAQEDESDSDSVCSEKAK